MNSHPGGDLHTKHLIRLSCLPPSSRWMDFGAGDGTAVRMLRSMGYEASGIDLSPRGGDVIKGDFTETGFPDSHYDGILSQCAFCISGNMDAAILEAARLLRPGGILAFSDVCFDLLQLLSVIKQSRFKIRHTEDLTAQWREYYFKMLWTEEVPICKLPKGKNCRYFLLICERV